MKFYKVTICCIITVIVFALVSCNILNVAETTEESTTITEEQTDIFTKDTTNDSTEDTTGSHDEEIDYANDEEIKAILSQIKKGMTEEELEAVMGSEGKEAGSGRRYLEWEIKDNVYLFVATMYIVETSEENGSIYGVSDYYLSIGKGSNEKIIFTEHFYNEEYKKDEDIMAIISRLEKGMTKEELDSIVGSEGINTSDRIVVLEWKIKEGYFLQIYMSETLNAEGKEVLGSDTYRLLMQTDKELEIVAEVIL